MTTLNLEKQYTAFETKRIADQNIKPHHVSLYHCLLAKWHRQRNNPVIRVSAREMMPMAKIGSLKTYYRTLKDLFLWGYLSGYEKAYKYSNVTMTFFYIYSTNDNPLSYLIEDIDIDKEKEIDRHPNAPLLEEVIAFYTAAALTPGQAMLFYEYYEKRNWKTKDGKPIRNWRFLATSAVNRLLHQKPASNDNTGKSKYEDPI